MELAALALLLVATFAGAFTQAATGFGFSILAAPVFLAILDSKAALPILVSLHVIQSVQLVPGVLPDLPRRELKALAIGALIGCPLGLVILRHLDVRTLKLMLGVLILGFVGLYLWRARLNATNSDAPPPRPGLMMLTGFASGLLTAILVMPGPPLMAALASKRWPRLPTRALSLTFFGGCYVAVLLLAVLAGDVTRATFTTAALLAPAAIAGTFAGRAAGTRLSDARFQTILLALMVLSGAGAILSAR